MAQDKTEEQKESVISDEMLKAGLLNVFAISRAHIANTQPQDEKSLLDLIQLRQEIFKRLGLDK